MQKVAKVIQTQKHFESTRILEEINLLKQIDHPNIIKMYSHYKQKIDTEQKEIPKDQKTIP